MPNISKNSELKKAREFAQKLRELALKSPDLVSLVIDAEDNPVNLFASRPKRLRSVSKMVIGLAYAREVANNPLFATEKVDLGIVDQALKTELSTYGLIQYTDNNAHAMWKNELPKGATDASHEEIVQGMLCQSSNNCTQYMLGRLGHEKVNAVIEGYGIDLELFGRSYAEKNNPLLGSSEAVVKLMNGIAAKEPPAVRAAFGVVALPLNDVFDNREQAVGFGKSGHFSNTEDTIWDINYAVHAQHEGKSVSVCFLTNDLTPSENQFLVERCRAFLHEASCNAGFRAECTKLFEKCETAPSLAGPRVAKRGFECG